MTPHEATVILGIPKAKSFGVIRSAYRKLAIKFHPDRSKEADASEQFKKIGLAFDALNQYQRDIGVWPIPRGYEVPKDFTGPKPPQPTYSENKKTTPKSPPPPPSGRRDKSWKKQVSQTQQKNYEHETSLVQAEEWNRKMARYFRNVFPNEAETQQVLNERFANKVSLDDVKTIMANHANGGAPIKIEYTPYGKKITFDRNERVDTRPINSAPLQSRNSGFSFGPPLKVQAPVGNYSVGYPQSNLSPTNGINPNPNLVGLVLRINPMIYNHLTGIDTSHPVILPAILQNGMNCAYGVYDIRWLNGIPYVNGMACSIVLDSSAPLQPPPAN